MYNDMCAPTRLGQHCDAESAQKVGDGLAKLATCVTSRARTLRRYEEAHEALVVLAARASASGDAAVGSANNRAAIREDSPGPAEAPTIGDRDLALLKVTGVVSRAAQSSYLDAICAQYNGTPAGEQVPAAYVHLDEDCNLNCPSASQLPAEPSLARVRQQVNAAEGKIILLLPVKIELEQVAIIDLVRKRIVVVASSDQGLVRLACVVAIRFARYVLDINDKFWTGWCRQHQAVPRMSCSVYLCWAVQNFLLQENGAVAADGFKDYLLETIRRLQQ